MFVEISYDVASVIGLKKLARYGVEEHDFGRHHNERARIELANRSMDELRALAALFEAHRSTASHAASVVAWIEAVSGNAATVKARSQGDTDHAHRHHGRRGLHSTRSVQGERRCMNYTSTIADMPEPYRSWCEANVQPPVRGKCLMYADRMLTAFPELRTVRGHVGKVHRDCEHWWCVTPDGTVIDPTAAQFRVGSVYIPFVEGSDEPTGVCPNCGEYCFNGVSVCTAECQREYAAYLRNPVV